MNRTMLAVRMTAWGEQPELCVVPVPGVGPGELLLRVDAAGICHSDLHVMDAAPGTLPYELPFTLGHEVAGTVVKIGDGVETRWLGRPVAVHGVWFCGECRNCQRGRENYCLQLTGPIGGGLGRDGGLAEYMLVPSERYLVPAEGVAAHELAPLTDAGLTAFHAIRPHLPLLQHDGRCVVIGVGGLGHLAIQILVASTDAHIIAVDTCAESRELATRLGACAVSPDLAGAVQSLAQLPGTDGVDLVLDFVGAQSTLDAATGLLDSGGALVIVGSGGGRLTAAKNVGLPFGWSVDAPFWGPRTDLIEVVDLARSDTVRAETEVFSLDEALQVYDRLRAGLINGRAVLIPGTARKERPQSSGFPCTIRSNAAR